MFFDQFMTPAAAGLLDSVAAPAAPAAKPAADRVQHVIDTAADAANGDMAAMAAAAVQEWCAMDSADLSNTETLADRLLSMLVGQADPDGSGDLSSGEEEMATLVVDSAWDYMANKGVSENDLSALFGGDQPAADAAAQRIRDMMCEELPDGEEAAFDDVNDHAYGPKPVMDSGMFKKVKAVRAGKLQIIRKRISGMAHRTAAQKMAIKKARLRSHGAGAMMHRAKSMRVRMARGL